MSKVVACFLGHCGATPNRYEVARGSQAECDAYIASLPNIAPEDECSYCGGYTGTVPVQEQCRVEAD